VTSDGFRVVSGRRFDVLSSNAKRWVTRTEEKAGKEKGGVAVFN
jgi:hypothetical protein